MKVNNQYCQRNWSRTAIHWLLSVIVAAILLCAIALQSIPANAVTNNEIAQDGEYDATLIATKSKDNKRYYATIYVGVEDGVISYISISASDKMEEFYKYVYPVAMGFVGKPASVSAIPDAVSSATQTDAVSSATSKGGSKYSLNLSEAIRTALSKAPAVPEEEEDDTPDTVASEGTYTGTAVMDNGHYITVEVGVDNAGKISTLNIKDADGDWDNLFASVISSYVGVYADKATGGNNAIDAVTSATTNGYRQAIADAIKNALSGNSPTIPDSGSDDNTDDNTDDPNKSDDDAGDTDDTGGTDTSDQPVTNDVVYESGTVQNVSDIVFTGSVTVKESAVITFENCTFTHGIILENENATAIVKNSYFGTESFYIPVASNEVGEFGEDTQISQESGVAALFPANVANKEKPEEITNAVLKKNAIENIPGWATATAQTQEVSGRSYSGYYLTGTTPKVEKDTYQSFNVYMLYGDDSRDSKLEVRIPVVMKVTNTSKDTKDDAEVDPDDDSKSDPVQTGWIQENGKWYYMDDAGIKQTGWIQVSSHWYFMDADGIMQTGWVKSGTNWYYMKSSGAMATGWVKVGGQWYYMASSGAMKTGWIQENGKWYYMKSSGAMATGWVQVGSTWYYMESNGEMHTGWLYTGGNWYYMLDSGAMVTGNRTIGSKIYRFNSNGVCLNP